MNSTISRPKDGVNGSWNKNAKALSVVHAELPDHGQCFLVLDRLRDRFRTSVRNRPGGSLDAGSCCRAVAQFSDDAAVNLRIVGAKQMKHVQGCLAAPEVLNGNPGAYVTHGVRETTSGDQTCTGIHLGDLKRQALRWKASRADFASHEVGELAVLDRLPSHVETERLD